VVYVLREVDDLMVPQWLVLQLKNRYPMLQYFTGRPFGVEIEFYGLDYLMTPIDEGIIKPYCIKSKSVDGRFLDDLAKDYDLKVGASRDTWHFQDDTSIRGMGGAEFVSPILRGIEGLMEVYSAFKLLCNIKDVKINRSCGFHVHHGVEPKHYGCRELKELVRIVYPMENYFYLLIPGDRYSSETCKPIEIDVEKFLEIACDKSTNEVSDIKKLWYSTENRYDPEAAPNPRYDKTRYHGLNLHSYWYHSTIEFRYHSAILKNVNEAMEWIIFTQFLVELSTGKVPTIDFYPSANKWMQTIYKIYLALGYKDRIRYIGSNQTCQVK